MIGVAEALRRAGGRFRERPWLVVLGLLGVLLSVGALFLAEAVVSDPGRGGFVAVSRTLLVATVLAALVRGIAAAAFVPVAYGAARGPADGSAWTGLGGRIGRSIGAAVLTHAAGLLLAGVAFVGLLAAYLPAATLFQAVGYGLGRGPVELTRWFLLGAGGVVFAAAAIAVGTLGVAGPLVDRDWIGYRKALRTSLGVAWADPLRVVAHGFVVGLLLVGPYLLVVPAAMLFELPGSEFGFLVVVVGVGTFSYALAPVYRAVVADHAVPAGGVTPTGSPHPEAGISDRPGGIHADRGSIDRRRVALAALVIAGLLAGSLAVRMADVRPTDASPTEAIDPGASGGEALATGLEVTGESSYTMTSDSYRVYPGNGTRDFEFRWVMRLDRADRQFELYGIRPESDGSNTHSVPTGGYVSESTGVAVRKTPVDDLDTAVATVRRTGSQWYANSWTVKQRLEVFDNTVLVVQGLDLEDAPPDAWRVVERTGDRVVVETRRGSYESVTEVSPEYVVNGSARVVLDADTGRILRVEHRRTTTFDEDDPPETTLTVAEFSAYGETDVTRPPALGSRGPVSYLVDALVY